MLIQQTEYAAIEILRHAVDAVYNNKLTRRFFRYPGKRADKIFMRQVSSPAFVRALADRLTPLIQVDINIIKNAPTLSNLASVLIGEKEVHFEFVARLFETLSRMFDYTLRHHSFTSFEWLHPWYGWKYFLPKPNDSDNEDFVLMCAQLTGMSAYDLGSEILGDSPVLVVDTMSRMISLIHNKMNELNEIYIHNGIDAFLQEYNNNRSSSDISLQPHNPNFVRSAIVYLVSGEACWEKTWEIRESRNGGAASF